MDFKQRTECIKLEAHLSTTSILLLPGTTNSNSSLQSMFGHFKPFQHKAAKKILNCRQCFGILKNVTCTMHYSFRNLMQQWHFVLEQIEITPKYLEMKWKWNSRMKQIFNAIMVLIIDQILGDSRVSRCRVVSILAFISLGTQILIFFFLCFASKSNLFFQIEMLFLDLFAPLYIWSATFNSTHPYTPNLIFPPFMQEVDSLLVQCSFRHRRGTQIILKSNNKWVLPATKVSQRKIPKLSLTFRAPLLTCFHTALTPSDLAHWHNPASMILVTCTPQQSTQFLTYIMP